MLDSRIIEGSDQLHEAPGNRRSLKDCRYIRSPERSNYRDTRKDEDYKHLTYT